MYYFWTLYSIPSVYKFICVPIYVFDYCSFIIQFEMRTYNVSSFVVSLCCFGYFWSFVVSYKLWIVFLFLEKKMTLGFWQILKWICQLLWVYCVHFSNIVFSNPWPWHFFPFVWVFFHFFNQVFIVFRTQFDNFYLHSEVHPSVVYSFGWCYKWHCFPDLPFK